MVAKEKEQEFFIYAGRGWGGREVKSFETIEGTR